MAYEFRLPDIGEGVAEGEVVKWFVKEGDTVQEDAPLVSVLTDKANVEIPSPKSGKILTLHAQVGQKVKVGGLLVTIDAGGGAPAGPAPTPVTEPRPTAPSPPTAAPASAASPTVAAGSPTTGRILATPQARRRATELGIDLSQVRGTGPNGRITDTDVNAAAKSATAPPSTAPAPSAAAPSVSAPVVPASATPSPAAPVPAPVAPSPTTEAVPTAPASPESAPARDVVDIERIPIRGLRRVIAEHMATANQRAALFTYVEEVDATELVRFRDRMAKHVEGDGVKLSYLPFILKGVVQGLRKHPWM
ncbi:MAG: 2-oxo acid dehydrogenase subunit E2, partial [Thermoplasmata archaeon]|nr:2-oxo acid dehydrogenase subunit E2 [Thermoplasmata archaeon]